MKASEMTNEQLDHYAALAQGWELDRCNRYWVTMTDHSIKVSQYSPTTNGAQCFELIEKFDINVGRFSDREGEEWYAFVDCAGNVLEMNAPNPKVAVCRAVIVSVFGEEVSE